VYKNPRITLRNASSGNITKVWSFAPKNPDKALLTIAYGVKLQAKKQQVF
jgi:hypothetical protein